MIDKSGAIGLVQKWLDSRNEDPLAYEKLVIDDKLTVEKRLFWGIYYRAEGAQPSSSPNLVIVDRQTGKLYSTVGSSWYNWLREFEQFKETGRSEIDWSRSEVRERTIGTFSLPERSYACVKASVKHEEKEQKLKELLKLLHAELGRQGATSIGNPEMMQRNKNEFRSEILIRIAYAGEAKENDVLSLHAAPATGIYYTDYVGNHYDFVGALHELKRYGRVKGIKEKGEPWIEYLEYDTERMSDNWINRICIPIE